VSRDGVALSPDLETTMAHLQALTTDNRISFDSHIVDCDNPLEADLLRYIKMDKFDPLAVMVWYQGKGAWANGPNMLGQVDNLIELSLTS
jgi:hypothetical protein